MGRGAGRGGQEAWSGLGNGEGKQSLASTAATALSSMTTKVGTTKPPSTAGTSRPTTIAASDILSSKPATAGSFSEDYVQARRSASLAIARKMKLAPGIRSRPLVLSSSPSLVLTSPIALPLCCVLSTFLSFSLPFPLSLSLSVYSLLFCLSLPPLFSLSLPPPSPSLYLPV